MPFRDAACNLSTTVLPPSSVHAAARSESVPGLKLKPLCEKRMAAAADAELEVAELCEEISRVMRKPAPKAQQERAPRGNSHRPSVPRRKLRAVPK